MRIAISHTTAYRYARPAKAEYGGEVQRACGSEASDQLRVMHALMAALHRDVGLEPSPTDAPAPAAQAFDRMRGAAEDHAHVFCAMARHLGAPARFVSG